MEICIKWTMCRTCTSNRSSQLMPLFDNRNLTEQLLEYAGLNMKPTDGLPDQICADCVENLKLTHSFLSGCKRADANLRNVVRQTMSSGQCFQSIAKEANATNTVRKQSNKSALNTVKSQSEISDLHDTDNSCTKALDEWHYERKRSSLSANINSQFSKSVANHKSNEEYLLIVSKSVSNKDDNIIIQQDNQYIIADKHNGIDNDSYAVIESDGQVIHDSSSHSSDKQESLIYSEIKLEPRESSSVSAIDLGDACLPDRFKSCVDEVKPKSHTHVQNNERLYECELCHKRFNAGCNLKTHMRTHTGEKPYGCDFCGRCFADRSSYRKHERMHTNERPYSCHVCGKSFSLSTTLKAHMLSHSNVKPHKCLTCKKGFRLPHQLKAHQKSHVHRYELGSLKYSPDDLENRNTYSGGC